jgi:alpha-tubulin suppressor-like RCC1 family protein
MGVLRCMGLNDRGQLGIPVTTNDTSIPQVIDLGGPVAQAAIGYDHTCAVLVDGTVKCFGDNNLGQLGSSVNNGTGTPNPTPQTVPLSGPAQAVSAGQFYTCALLRDGTVQCLGTNQYGSLGVAFNSNTINPTPTPQTVALGGAAVSIDSGTFGTCAVLDGGAVKCWGSNFYGELGSIANNGNFNPNLPLSAGVPGAAGDVSFGNSFTCFVTQAQAVDCAGYNQYGQLGNATNNGTGNPNPAPTAVPLNGPGVQAASGGDFSCALIAGGSVECFGNNDRGQLGNTTGNGSSSAHPSPTTVAGLSGPAVAIAAGYNFLCAIMQSGTVQCWGNNGAGQLGIDSSINFSASPVTVDGLQLLDAPPPVAKTVLRVKKPKFKTKKSGKKIVVSANVAVLPISGALDPGSCTGSFKASLSGKISKKRTKRYTSKNFKLRLRKSVCSFDLKLKLPKSTGGKKLSLTLTFSGNSAVDEFRGTFSERIKRLR